MFTPEEAKPVTDVISKLNNNEIASVIAYFNWMETTDPSYWQDALGVYYDKQDVTDVKNLLWTEATKRGISVADVKAKIDKLAQNAVNENISQMKSDASFRALLIKQSDDAKRNSLIKRVLLIIVAAVVIFLIVKNWGKITSFFSKAVATA